MLQQDALTASIRKCRLVLVVGCRMGFSAAFYALVARSSRVVEAMPPDYWTQTADLDTTIQGCRQKLTAGGAPIFYVHFGDTA